METLNAKARLVLAYAQSYYAEHGCPPTVREICAGCGIKSTRSVSDYLKLLERGGHIRRREGRSRGIELAADAVRPVGTVPVLGRIAAGQPLGAEAYDAGALALDSRSVFGADGCFALRVQGDSMIDRHIVEGDYAVIRPQPVARDGDVVAVDIDGEVTLKEFRRQGPRVLLRPANPAYAPIALDGSEGPVRILGVMVGLVRAA
ncbi:MAG: transcriptional repressor LexA [Nitrospirae bacterium]|nr:transcriptional repressor LexA [Nitrospirota bacterium]